jgi:hypothetical protein
MDPIQFALEPRDRTRSPKRCEETAAYDDTVPPGAFSWVILAAVLLLIPVILVGSLSAHRSGTNVIGVAGSGEPFIEAEELDERIPRGWQ